MSVIVKKFGGTSVATIERIEFVADQICKFYQNNKKIVVVVSAMQGETDQLEKLAQLITKNPAPREMAALLATGEQLTMSLLCIALIKKGCPAKSYTGLQLGINTDRILNNARIKNINKDQIQQDLANNTIVVVAGFQGVDAEYNITTLGRGGSDTTAVAIAAVLQAKECCIYTDVDGIYTADPNLEPNAKKLDSIDFSEMLELAGLGAKVMQIRAVELGSYYNIPIRVLSSFNTQDSQGTLIVDHYNKNNKNNLDYNQVIKIAALRDQINICINNITYKNILLILNNLAAEHIDFDMLNIQQNHNLNNINNLSNLSFVSNLKYVEQITNIINIINKYAPPVVISGTPMAKVSLVGLGLGSNPELITKIYNSLEQVNIMIKQITTSEIKVSILLNDIDVELAIKILHEVFVL